jgi:hypothetical protein
VAFNWALHVREEKTRLSPNVALKEKDLAARLLLSVGNKLGSWTMTEEELSLVANVQYSLFTASTISSFFESSISHIQELDLTEEREEIMLSFSSVLLNDDWLDE